MSKNISIKEGDVARKFRPVDRLNVITDNAPAMWRPEDTFRTGTLHVAENGIYIASLNGYAAYTEIDVRVTDKVGSIDPDDYDYITPDMVDYPDVWDESALDFDEDELNDPDEWPDVDDWDDSEETDYDPYDPESSSEDFDPKKVKPKKIKVKNPKEKKIKGVDPVSGQEYEVTAKEPEGEAGDMELTTELLPSAIHIVVWPAKRKYEEGETIDFSGIHVYLLDDRHRRFTTEQYPTGEIPFGELIFPVTTATAGDVEQHADIADKTGLSDEVVNVLPVTFCSATSLDTSGLYIGGGGGEGVSPYKDYPYITIESASSEVYAYITETNTSNYYHLVSKEPFTIRTTTHNQYGVYSNLHYGESISVNNKTFYIDSGGSSEVRNRSFNIGSNIVQDHPKEVGYVILYGEISGAGGKEIPVEWMRSDGVTLEDTFTIEVGEGGEPEQPQEDPFANSYDFEWDGKYYNFNRKLAEGEVIYSNGTVYQTWIGGQSPPYTVPQAVKMGLCFQVQRTGSSHTGGGF